MVTVMSVLMTLEKAIRHLLAAKQVRLGKTRGTELKTVFMLEELADLQIKLPED